MNRILLQHSMLYGYCWCSRSLAAFIEMCTLCQRQEAEEDCRRCDRRLCSQKVQKDFPLLLCTQGQGSRHYENRNEKERRFIRVILVRRHLVFLFNFKKRRVLMYFFECFLFFSGQIFLFC